jgi:hypothetical protein
MAGMELAHYRLLPGVEVRTLSILLAFWDRMDAVRGQNVFRSLHCQYYSPRTGGKPLQLQIALSMHGTTEAIFTSLPRSENF